ncbi:hypothetical protein PG994_000456 [Apiospora phragmitis]|uniref:Importin N-terminal domain-containing protein n=1 Tax=Apiospora phragmitis TaxID=2905665 RepID=A0ABR1X682_9PEZI
MAANGVGDQEAFAPAAVLDAVLTMRSNDAGRKKKAATYLENFQKSPSAWTTTITILKSDAEPEAKVFAATTLKGKITYDLSTQVPAEEHPAVRAQLLELLQLYASGPRPIRVQLCVCLAILAIQMTQWKDVLPLVVSSLGNQPESHACILDFLRVSPEEVTEGRKISLSDEELTLRTTELLSDNAPQVVQLLINYAHSSPQAATNPQLLECITSWLREVPINDLVNSPLLGVVFNALESDDSFQEAAECLSSMVRETREVDDNVASINIMLPRVIGLRPKIQQFVEEEDTEGYKSLTRVFSDAGIAWVCVERDKERDVIEYTFDFWYELKQYLVLERYIQARMELVDVYSKLVDSLLKHLQYPDSEDGRDANARELFGNDLVAEEKFREFRHHMGDTLKDACEVMGVTDCLTKVLDAIRIWTQKYGGMATATAVPHWQELEAPLFSMRAMGRMVEKDESIVLPQLMPLLIQIPAHEKLRFATIMVLGRYTEWTAAHPELFEGQFNYIVSSFQTDSKEVVRAAAMAIKYFCQDCKHLLGAQVDQLQQFYDQVLDSLQDASQEEITEDCGYRAPSGAGEEDPAVKYWMEIFPILAKMLAIHRDKPPGCHDAITARDGQQTGTRFPELKTGLFPLGNSAILREFSDDREHVDQSITDSIYTFFEAQATNVLRFISELSPQELPDVTEDFFRLMIDALLYYPHKLIPSQLFTPIFEAAISVLGLEQRPPLSATLHYVRDLLSWGGKNPPSSLEHVSPGVDVQLQNMVKQLIVSQGDALVKRLLADHADRDSRMGRAHPYDASAGTVTPAEVERLMIKIKERLGANDTGEVRQIRSILQDFTNTYRRRYVAPRDGLGELEASRFRFEG